MQIYSCIVCNYAMYKEYIKNKNNKKISQITKIQLYLRKSKP